MNASPEPPIASLPARPRRLAVVGWSPEAADAVAALEDTLAFQTTIVADPSVASLVLARRSTALSCTRDVTGTLRAGEYDAVLLSGAAIAQHDAARLAASRGAALLLLADGCDGAGLDAAAHAAAIHAVPLALFRPTHHDPGIPDLRQLVQRPEWAPIYLDITVEAPTDPDRLLGVAASWATLLASGLGGTVRASSWGAPPRAVTATISGHGNDDDGTRDGARQVSMRVRHAPELFVRITADSAAGAFELRCSADEAELVQVRATGERISFQPARRDPHAAEAARVAAMAPDDDRERVATEAALLSAVTRSLLAGEEQEMTCCQRPELRLLSGGGDRHSRSRRANHLRLVVS